jgi:MinD-like ATPase involved in chromosome partitioning or flagellar assembly
MTVPALFADERDEPTEVLTSIQAAVIDAAVPAEAPAAEPMRRQIRVPRFAALARRVAAPRQVEDPRAVDRLLAESRVYTEDLRRPFRRPMTVLVANPKGGSGKTPLSLLLSGSLSLMRGGHVLAWDNNEARGGLVQRADVRGGENRPTVRHLLADLAAFETHRAGMGELAGYLHPQEELYDVLAADDDFMTLHQIEATDFTRLHHVLRRYYRIMVLDSGNNVRSAAWQAAASVADCLVLASTYDQDSVAAARWTLDHLRASGRGDLADRAVTVLTAASGRPDVAARMAATEQLAGTAALVEVPFDGRLRMVERVRRTGLAEPTLAALTQAAHAIVGQLAKVDAGDGVVADLAAAAAADPTPVATPPVAAPPAALAPVTVAPMATAPVAAKAAPMPQPAPAAATPTPQPQPQPQPDAVRRTVPKPAATSEAASPKPKVLAAKAPAKRSTIKIVTVPATGLPQAPGIQS